MIKVKLYMRILLAPDRVHGDIETAFVTMPFPPTTGMHLMICLGAEVAKVTRVYFDLSTGTYSADLENYQAQTVEEMNLVKEDWKN